MCRKEGVLMPVNVNEIEPDEKIVEIEMERLREFRNHPFKVKADAQMLQLIESISKYGILNPLIVRPLPEGVYEIIAGHRRKYAAQHLGFRKMPVIIRVLRDDDAVINMVDSNLFRETIRPSEKARISEYQAIVETCIMCRRNKTHIQRPRRFSSTSYGSAENICYAKWDECPAYDSKIHTSFANDSCIIGKQPDKLQRKHP